MRRPRARTAAHVRHLHGLPSGFSACHTRACRRGTCTELDTSSRDPETSTDPNSFIPVAWTRARRVRGCVWLALNRSLVVGKQQSCWSGSHRDCECEGERAREAERTQTGRRASHAALCVQEESLVSTALARSASCNHVGGNHDWEMTTTSQGGG